MAEDPRGVATVVTQSRIRGAMARNMATAATVPQFRVNLVVDFSEILELRAESAAPRPSVTAFLVRSCATTLRAHPAFNSSYEDGAIILHSRVNIGVAMALDDGLVVPTVYDADLKPPQQIHNDLQHLKAQRETGRFTREQLAGATFTISNLAMYGIHSVDPLLNVPQVAILGVGAPLKAGDKRNAWLTLACDHRAITGGEGAQFLATLGEALEHPVKLSRPPEPQ